MSIVTLEKKLKAYEAPARGVFLRWLYAHFPPRVIGSAGMHRRYMKAVEILMTALELDEVPREAREDVRRFLDVITRLLEAYERQRYPTKAEPEDVLRFLMDQHGLTQTDLAEDLGGQPVVSAVLNGKRELTREHIERLSKRFHVSPAVFFPA